VTIAGPARTHAQSQPLQPGFNAFGYVSANQVFDRADCGVGQFAPPFPNPVRFVNSPTTINCVDADWQGQSIMDGTGRALRSFSSVTANGFVGNNVVALSRVWFMDSWSITGGTPTQATFSFYLSGSTSESVSPGTTAHHTAAIGVEFNTLLPAPAVVDQGVVTPPGAYSFSFGITPGMLTNPIFFNIGLITFANLTPSSPGGAITGTSTTDFASTLTLQRVQFFEAQADGSLLDITNQLNVVSASGTDYLSTVPEPGVVVLMGTGLLLLGIAARRRHRSTAA